MSSAVLLLLLLAAPAAAATTQLPWLSNVFGSHMVLQQAPLRASLWGWTPMPTQVSVSLTQQGGVVEQHVVTPDAQSRWTVALQPRVASTNGTSFEITVQSTVDGTTRAYITDVVFGELWLCSGQSNMQMPLVFDFNASAELAAADARSPMLRFIDVGDHAENVVGTPQPTLNAVTAPWSRATSKALLEGGGGWNGFSDVCYLFGRRLLEQFQVPIGLIGSSWGGTIIQAWMAQSAIDVCPPPSLSQQQQTLQRVVFNPFVPPIAAGLGPNNFTVLFNGMIAPFVPMSLRGVVWYQGEQNSNLNYNCGGPRLYGCLFRSLIADWRRLFGAHIGFHFVQLPGSTDYFPHGDPDGFYPELRLQQASVLDNNTNVCMASAVDLGDWFSPLGSVHPRLKEPVAQRLFQCALAVTYGIAGVPFAGPQLSHVAVHAASIELRFKNVGAGLRVRSNATAHEMFCPRDCNNCCAWFDVELGRLGNWIALNGTISSPSTVELRIPQGLAPTAVRYLFGDWPIATICNEFGLPLTPFVVPLTATTAATTHT